MKHKTLRTSILMMGTLSICSGMPAGYAATDCAAVTEIPKSQCETLLSLYNNTGGATWYDHSGWNITTTPCSWKGVSCDPYSAIAVNNVTKLELPSNKLTGTLPDLSALTELQELKLNNNNLSGAIPTLSSLTKLQVLNLSSNQFTGVLPGLNALVALNTLRVKNNQLSGPIPALSALTLLTTVDVSNNVVTTTTGATKPPLCIDTTLDYGTNQARLTAALNGLQNCSPTIYGIVFNDINANGVKDANETLRVGDTVNFKNTATNETVTPAATTDSNGYLKKDLPIGTYEVTITPPEGWTQKTPATLSESTVTVASNVDTKEVTFGVYPSTAITMDFGTSTVGEVTFGTADYGKQSCTGTCTLHYPKDKAITLTATKGPYIVFSGWSGDCGKPESADSGAKIVIDTASPKTVTIADRLTDTTDLTLDCKADFQKFNCLLPGLQIDFDQCNALKSLFDNNNGTEWYHHENWLETLTPCSSDGSGWFGVSCGIDKDGKTVVTKLELPGNNLSGSLADTDLSFLKGLTTLDLSGSDRFMGAVPSWINEEDMPALQKLTLTGTVSGTTVTGFCRRLTYDYGKWYDILGLQDCPPQVPIAIFTVSVQSSDGYKALLDASRSTSANGLISEYQWTVSAPTVPGSSSMGKTYYPVYPTTAPPVVVPSQAIKPVTYTVLGEGETPPPTITPTDGKTPITTDTPKLSLTFPQGEATYAITLVVKDVVKDATGKLVPGNLPSSPKTQEAPVPMSTLVLSKIGEGSGTFTVKQKNTTTPSTTTTAPSATCCLKYPEEHYNAVGETEAELIAAPWPGSEFKGWSGTGCTISTSTTDTTSTTSSADTTATPPPSVTMTTGETKKCIAEFQVIEPAPAGMHKLTVKKDPEGVGSGSVVARDGTINCGDDNKPDCKENYEVGKLVQLKAVAGLNSNFVGWTVPKTESAIAPGCAGQKSPMVRVVIPLDRNVECIANFEADRNTGGVIETDKCYGEGEKRCKMDTSEPIDKWFPQHFMNEARMREALSLAEPVKQLLKSLLDQTSQTTLADTWPSQLKDINFCEKKPCGELIESIRLRHDAEVFGFITPESSVTVQGYYIEVRVKLLTDTGAETVLPILIYYGEQPSTRSGHRGLKYRGGCGCAMLCG